MLADRPNPTRYDIEAPGVVTSAPVQREIVADLERARPRVVVRDTSPVTAAPEPNAAGRSSGVTLLDDHLARGLPRGRALRPARGAGAALMEVRRLLPGELDLLRDVRLRALRDAPSAFGSSYEREAAFGAAEWAQRVATAVFVAVEDERALGMAGGFVDERGSTILWGMWVDPAARGRGLAEPLVDGGRRVGAEHRRAAAGADRDRPRAGRGGALRAARVRRPPARRGRCPASRTETVAGAPALVAST